MIELPRKIPRKLCLVSLRILCPLPILPSLVSWASISLFSNPWQSVNQDLQLASQFWTYMYIREAALYWIGHCLLILVAAVQAKIFHVTYCLVLFLLEMLRIETDTFLMQSRGSFTALPQFSTSPLGCHDIMGTKLTFVRVGVHR